jgi:hypothetical protein
MMRACRPLPLNLVDLTRWESELCAVKRKYTAYVDSVNQHKR